MFRRVNKYYRMIRRKVGLSNNHNLYFITPQNNWVLDWVGYYLTTNVEQQFNLSARVLQAKSQIVDHIVHYGSLWDLTGLLKHPDFNQIAHNNYLIGTIFHGNRSNPDFYEAIRLISGNLAQIEKIVVSTNMMYQRLLGWGIPRGKIVQIPLGVDTQKFVPLEEGQRVVLRSRFGIPEGAVCIGSFQKDGVGLGEGLEPKLIKGPDVFLAVVEKLARDFPIFVLLTGPARGYVKQGLDKIGVPYRHDVLDNYLDIVSYFQAIDLYIVTAREEGGPQSLLEAPACGVPLVTTKVGMAPDIHTHERTVLMTEIEDVDGLVAQTGRIIEDGDLRLRLIKNGLEVAKAHDWQKIAARYYHEVYAPILNNNS